MTLQEKLFDAIDDRNYTIFKFTKFGGTFATYILFKKGNNKSGDCIQYDYRFSFSDSFFFKEGHGREEGVMVDWKSDDGTRESEVFKKNLPCRICQRLKSALEERTKGGVNPTHPSWRINHIQTVLSVEPKDRKYIWNEGIETFDLTLEDIENTYGKIQLYKELLKNGGKLDCHQKIDFYQQILAVKRQINIQTILRKYPCEKIYLGYGKTNAYNPRPCVVFSLGWEKPDYRLSSIRFEERDGIGRAMFACYDGDGHYAREILTGNTTPIVFEKLKKYGCNEVLLERLKNFTLGKCTFEEVKMALPCCVLDGEFIELKIKGQE